MNPKSKIVKKAGNEAANAEQSIYSVKELAENAEKVFGAAVRKECVVAAFRMKNRDSATLEEAKGIVDAFMKREVR